MKLSLRVEYDGKEPEIVVAVFADFCVFEETHQRSVAKFETDLRLNDLGWLAWHVQKRTKKTSLEYSKWRETVTGVLPVGDDEPVPLESSQQLGT